MDINTPYINDPVQLDILRHSMHGRLEYTLMNDFLSKYSLQKDLFALKGLLAALLSVEIDSITAIEILNPIEPAELIGEKDCVLDIKLELNHREIINIEIQSRYQDFWPERSITYLSRAFNQLSSGSSYSNIKPCLHIGIMNTDLFKENDPRFTGEFYSEYRLLNTSTHTDYSSKFRIRVLSLNRLEDASEEEKSNPNSLYRWAKLFRASSWEELKMIASENERMQSFVGTVRQLSAEEKVAQACERRMLYELDKATYEYEISEKEAQIASLDSEIANKNATIADKNATIADKDNEIETLKARLAELEKLVH